MPKHTPAARYRRRQVLAVLAIFAFCGTRASELLSLTVDDYTTDPAGKRILRVRKGKGRQIRWIPVNSQCAGYLAEWLEVRAQVLADRNRSESALFLNDKYRPMGQRALWSLWEELLAHAGLSDSGIVRHSLRHWFGSGAAQEDLVTAKELLGHSSIQTTAAYLHSQPERMRNAVNNLVNLVSRREETKAQEARDVRPRESRPRWKRR